MTRIRLAWFASVIAAIGILTTVGSSADAHLFGHGPRVTAYYGAYYGGVPYATYYAPGPYYYDEPVVVAPVVVTPYNARYAPAYVAPYTTFYGGPAYPTYGYSYYSPYRAYRPYGFYPGW